MEVEEAYIVWEKMLSRKIDSFWSGLSEEEKLMAFLSVVSKLRKGWLEDGKSAKDVLFDVFKFGNECYLPAEYAGYFAVSRAVSRTNI